ncbi:MAG: glycosyltransferase family 2 protein, partial [Ginsengibacter sp.]
MITNKAENAESKVPFFSVIITTYNRAGLLIRALESLTSQEETDWEGIIVDDGSTDDTAIAVLPYLKPGSNFRYIRQQNTGYSDAKNTGIFSATGKYVTFLDSDDE